MADASINIVKTVNFGSGLSGRESHVFYEVFDTLGTGSISRTNSGIYSLGSTSGIYGVLLTLGQAFSGSIVWQVTASNGNVVFASDEVETDTKVSRHFAAGQWEIEEGTKQMVFYQEDNTTELARFQLSDRKGTASFEEIFKRERL